MDTTGLIFDKQQFPTTRYQGSKRKILPWIYEVVKDIPFETVLDACGGTASVSYLFKKMGKQVTYNDNLKFNHIIGKAIIENNKIKFSDNDIQNLLSIHDEIEYKKIIQKNFKDIYYLHSENIWLDKVVCNISNMNHYTGTTLEYKKALAYYALFQASMIKRPFNLFHRRNLNLRTNDVERNFGNKASWDTSYKIHLINFIKEINGLIFDSGESCSSINMSIFDITDTNYELVYIDPPYFLQDSSNETSDYLKCYHFLEGIVNYKEWTNFIDYDTPNLRFKKEDKNKYFNKENIYENFEEIIKKFRYSKIVLSYKNGGIPSKEFLINLMKKYKKTVFTKSLQYNYALNRQNGDAKKNREVLIIGL